MNDRILHSLLMVKYTFIERRENQKGASAVEYGLLVALIAAVIVLAVLLLGDTIKNIFNDTSKCLSTQTSADCN